ncbi:type II/III secretion system protein [Pseudomonas duriflava]|uniref:Type II/III secretion system protein n=1 Tax=Pseudomonas duriflava TaxID=459528 RepID=A0A562Q8T9_9PSED|nr:secretin N-terminal domain-containing protein [Pseudomonas duriflava]TWI53128.1 type II/III secretion system protein [Pseudomonas duriflava]
MRRLQSLTLFAMLLSGAFSAQGAVRTEIVALNYRTADELLPVIQSLLGNEGKASAYGNQLIINTEASKLNEVKDLLLQLDTPPHRLLISVDTRASGEDSDQGYTINGNIGRQHNSQTRIISRSTGSQQDGIQQVQATEGTPARVHIGQSIPVTTTEIDGYGRPYTRMEYRDANRGFYVTASLTGNIVHLSIEGGNDTADRYNPNIINTQSTQTRVSGRLGEWITLSGFSQNASSTDEGILYNYSTQGRSDTQLRVKVDITD